MDDLPLIKITNLFQRSPDAVMAVGTDGLIKSWNPAAGRMFGYSPSQAVGLPESTLIPEAERETNAAQIHGALAGREFPPYETTAVRRDGSLVHVSVSLTPMQSSAGPVAAVLVTMRDITRQKEAEAPATSAPPARVAALPWWWIARR